LSIGELFELARVCPDELDGVEMENKIRDCMQKLVFAVESKQTYGARDLTQLITDFKGFQQKYTSDTRRVSEIPQLNLNFQKL
jgi:hypothetical protein